MNCSKAQTLLSAYIDREISGVEMLSLREHLHECESCQAEVEALRTVKAMLSGVEIPEPSADFEERLVRNVMNQGERRLRWRMAFPWLERPVIAASGFALVTAAACTLVVLAISHGDNPSSIVPSHEFSGGPSLGVADVSAPHPKQDPSMAIDRDQAMIAGADPLSGPRPAVDASYASR